MKKLVENFFSEIEEKLSPDPRFIVFKHTIQHNKDKINILIRISDKKLGKLIKNLFLSYFKGSMEKVKLRILQLPDLKTIPLVFGIGNSGYSPIYRFPSNKSEQVTQLLFGETFDVLEVSPNKLWYLIRLHNDRYVGWVSKNSITLTNEKYFRKWVKARKVTIIKKMVEIKNSPDNGAENLRESFVSTRLPLLKKKNAWVSILLPDSRIGWIPANSIKMNSNIKIRGSKKILKTARLFLGVSYLWGGRSPQGIDCSGLVQMVFNLNGHFLPRDANLQFKEGIDVGKDFTNFKSCDLLFFGDDSSNITHVGIYTGEDKKFIHSSGFVKYGSLNKSSEFYDDRLNKIFIGSRRVLKD